ncbi:hypothetical protein HPB50_011954 [Hyalomma asiaticum]|uniref:Uncharacterized protein n=1 Tax=Hyalomma asiaticum TaxID=266040 RepID=A0ACB7T9V4_HYAAI|nr:hypothetical protein HPB50_011954 [Hyalomma asiaticum]
MEELRSAIHTMPPSSAPGSDGLTKGFYATFLDTLPGTLLTLVNAIVKHHKKPNYFGAGQIVLPLKDGAPANELSSWRQITLLNLGYKMAATIINDRLQFPAANHYLSSSISRRASTLNYCESNGH